MKPTLFFIFILVGISAISSIYAIDVITSDERITIKTPIRTQIDIPQVDFRNTWVNGGVLITNDEFNSLQSRTNSPKEIGEAPHRMGMNVEKYNNQYPYKFEGADMKFIYNGGGAVLIQGTATSDILEVYCHGQHFRDYEISNGDSFRFWMKNIPLEHQIHPPRIIDSWSDGYFEYSVVKSLTP